MCRDYKTENENLLYKPQQNGTTFQCSAKKGIGSEEKLKVPLRNVIGVQKILTFC